MRTKRIVGLHSTTTYSGSEHDSSVSTRRGITHLAVRACLSYVKVLFASATSYGKHQLVAHSTFGTYLTFHTPSLPMELGFHLVATQTRKPSLNLMESCWKILLISFGEDEKGS